MRLALEKCALVFLHCVLEKMELTVVLFPYDIILNPVLKTTIISIRLNEWFPESFSKLCLLQSFCHFLGNRF